MNIPKHCMYIPVLAAAALTVAAQTTIDLPTQVRTQGRNLDFSAAGATKPMKTGTTLPSSCSTGEMFFKTDAPAGTNLYGCTAANSWSVQTGGGTGEANTASNSGVGGVGLFRQKLGTDLEFKNLNSASSRVSVVNDVANREVDIDVVQSNLDLSAIGGALTAAQIAAGSRQGNGAKVQMSAITAFAANDCAKLDSNGNITTAGAPCGAGTSGTGTPNPSQSFTSATLVNFTHGLGSTNVLVQCYNTANQAIEYGSLAIADTNTVAVTFTVPQSGRCVANGTGGTSSGGGGGSGEVNTASNAGVGGVGLFHQKFGIDLQFKNLNTGSGRVSVANDATNREVDIDVVPANIDLATIGGALGASQIAGSSRQGNGSKVQMSAVATFAANDCAKLDSGGNIVSAGSPCGSGGGSGEVNTASNAGVGGVGLFHQKVGVDLQFKSVNAASGRVSVANDAANREVDIDVVQSSLDLSAMGGALAASQIAAASKQGNGAKLQAFGSGTVAADDCAKFDANGNIVSAGTACGSGGGDSITGDFGIVVTTSTPGTKKVSVDTATVPTFLTASTNIDFASISANTCLEQTIALPGAATGDAVAAGWPQTLESGLSGIMFVGVQNSVTVRVCKVTAGTVDPALQNFRATIVRSF